MMLVKPMTNMYGSNGGMDVENWEIQTCEQFRLTHLPENVGRLYKDREKKYGNTTLTFYKMEEA